ncbi:MAG TPA: ABC transporter substrate-binding protein [Candidatus Binatia bacterium]|nr:ABC transporter substrate-binding protein [Candidatus Binatia bacterium]
MFRAGLLVAAALSLSAIAASPAAAKVTVSISCSSLGIEMELCRDGAQAWATKTGNEVRLVSTPADANERLALYQSLLAAKSDKIDVFQIDVVWPGILANQFLDLNQLIGPGRLGGYFQTLIVNNTVNGKLVAVPWFVDAGMLYYRKDLLDKYQLKVPETWAELQDDAKKVMTGESGIEGYVWQGRAYEGLLCNALEWIASNGGGMLLDNAGKATFNNPQAAAAIDRARGWIGTISPEGVLSYDEEQARGAFQSGKAVFMRNWPYAWALVNAADSPVKGKVGVAPLPKGDGDKAVHAGALGGQSLAVSKYSAHPKEAVDLVLYLTGPEEEKRRALKGAFNPSLKIVYQEPELKNDAFFSTFAAILNGVATRPAAVAGRKYNQFSSEFVRAVHATLSGESNAADNFSSVRTSWK